MSSTVVVHVGVAATDLNRSLRFWHDALGLPVKEDRGGLVVLSDGLHNITVFEYQGQRPNNVPGHAGYLHIGVKVDDLADALRRCLSLGFSILCDDIDKCRDFDPSNPPKQSFKVEDPDGIVVDVTSSDTQWVI